MQDAAALVRVAPNPTVSRKPNASGAGLDKDPDWQMVGFCPKNKAGTHPARAFTRECMECMECRTLDSENTWARPVPAAFRWQNADDLDRFLAAWVCSHARCLVSCGVVSCCVTLPI